MYTYIDNYVYMQDNYVYMYTWLCIHEDIFTYMQDNNIYIQDNYVYKIT